MPGNWPVPFGKGLSEKDPGHGHLVGCLLHLKRRGLETEHHATAPVPDPTESRTLGSAIGTENDLVTTPGSRSVPIWLYALKAATTSIYPQRRVFNSHPSSQLSAQAAAA
jgi:hypothetical protein